MIIQNVKFQSKLTDLEVVKVALEREKEMFLVPGLIQKYYVMPADGQYYGADFVWDSEESMDEYWSSELADTFESAYEVSDWSTVETVNVLFHLRN